MKSTESVYHVTRQDFHFAHVPVIKNKKLKIAAKKLTDDKTFRSTNELPLGKSMLGNCLCEASTA